MGALQEPVYTPNHTLSLQLLSATCNATEKKLPNQIQFTKDIKEVAELGERNLLTLTQSPDTGSQKGAFTRMPSVDINRPSKLFSFPNEDHPDGKEVSPH